MRIRSVGGRPVAAFICSQPSRGRSGRLPAAVLGGFLRRVAAALLLFAGGGAGVWAWLFRVLSSLLTASTRPDVAPNSLPEAPPVGTGPESVT